MRHCFCWRCRSTSFFVYAKFYPLVVCDAISFDYRVSSSRRHGVKFFCGLRDRTCARAGEYVSATVAARDDVPFYGRDARSVRIDRQWFDDPSRERSGARVPCGEHVVGHTFLDCALYRRVGFGSVRSVNRWDGGGLPEWGDLCTIRAVLSLREAS
jgi:hypothetical protein